MEPVIRLVLELKAKNIAMLVGNVLDVTIGFKLTNRSHNLMIRQAGCGNAIIIEVDELTMTSLTRFDLEHVAKNLFGATIHKNTSCTHDTTALGGGQHERWGRKSMKLWREYKLKRRLRKMERALHIRLNDEQRKIVLDANPPNVLAGWCRRSGKTTCACMHLLLHSPVTHCYSSGEAMQLLKDPDKNLGPNVRRWTYMRLCEMRRELNKEGIRTCVLHPPMPNVPEGYIGHGRFDGRRQNERG